MFLKNKRQGIPSDVHPLELKTFISRAGFIEPFFKLKIVAQKNKRTRISRMWNFFVLIFNNHFFEKNRFLKKFPVTCCYLVKFESLIYDKGQGVKVCIKNEHNF